MAAMPSFLCKEDEEPAISFSGVSGGDQWIEHDLHQDHHIIHETEESVQERVKDPVPLPYLVDSKSLTVLYFEYIPEAPPDYFSVVSTRIQDARESPMEPQYLLLMSVLHHHFVVTGGQDDKAFVWNLSNQEILFECVGHQDSVTCVKFSHDDKYVASSDLGGVVKARLFLVGLLSGQLSVWDLPTKKLRHVCQPPKKERREYFIDFI
ncbi:uncharacterized protein LOC121391844 [Gigantopelta aegis]|uniref:uncharacterized protein LOC121391844 n=1 Tax=Gigantopelta aegis TaxID=1735272 RepID=UPI001B8874BF|nr:uncharacterized protein LOC121391844 [Gigantopelta aegis]